MAAGFAAFDLRGAKVLLPRADIATDTLSSGLRSLGADLDEVDAYRTVVPDGAAKRAKELLASGGIDTATFTSSSTVRNLVDLLGGDVSLLDGVRIVSIGPVTSATARELGLRVEMEAEEHTVAGVVDALLADASAAVPATAHG